jgi:hypothetical protein
LVHRDRYLLFPGMTLKSPNFLLGISVSLARATPRRVRKPTKE